MKKSVLCIILLSIVFLLGGCATSSSEGIVNEDIHPVMPEYVSDFTPPKAPILPVIKITSESGKNDFVSLPVDADITNLKRGWGGNPTEPAPWYENCLVTVIDGNNQINLNNVEARVKVRGNWTSNYPKKPLKIQFENKQSVLGLNNNAKMKNWVLLASYKDWSFLRDQTAYYLGHLTSPLYTSDFSPVEVYVNNKYQGVYILAEKQEVDKNRINLPKPNEDYTGTDIGYLIELDGHSKADESSFKIRFPALKDRELQTVTSFEEVYTVKSRLNTKDQFEFIKNYMNNLWQLCYEAVYLGKYYKFNEDYSQLVPSNAKNCYECVSSVIDIESLVNTYLLHEIVCDADFYYTSFYMDVNLSSEGNKKLTFEAPWDNDSALGNKRHCQNSQGLFAAVNQYEVNYERKGYGNPWFLIFINCSWFQEMVSQKWTYIHNQKVVDKLVDLIDFETTQYQKNFEANYALWKNAGMPWTIGKELCSKSGACKNQKEAAEYLKQWLIKRFESLDEIFLAEK